MATLAIGSVPLLRDFRAKVTRAAEVEGFRFLHTFGVPARLALSDRSVDRGRPPRRRVECVPLWECDGGEWRITFRPKRLVPVADYLATQGVFGHLSPEQVETIQAHVDARWEQLEAQASDEAALRPAGRS